MTVRIRDHAAQFTRRTSLATDDFQNTGVIEHPSGDRQQFPCIRVGDAMPQCPKSSLSGSISQSSDPLHIIFDPDSKFISSFFCLHCLQTHPQSLVSTLQFQDHDLILNLLHTADQLFLCIYLTSIDSQNIIPTLYNTACRLPCQPLFCLHHGCSHHVDTICLQVDSHWNTAGDHPGSLQRLH